MALSGIVRGKIMPTHSFPRHSDSGHFENWTKIFHCPTSSGASKQCERMSERTSEWPDTNVPISRGSESLCKASDNFAYWLGLRKLHQLTSSGNWDLMLMMKWENGAETKDGSTNPEEIRG